MKDDQDIERFVSEMERELTGPEQVTLFNEMVRKAHAMGRTELKEVSRFASAQVGRGRCAAMISTLRAFRESEAAIKAEDKSRSPGPARLVEGAEAPQEETEMARPQSNVTNGAKRGRTASKVRDTKAPKKAAAKATNGLDADYKMSDRITVLTKDGTNPKKGATARKRFALYRSGMTVSDYMKAVGDERAAAIRISHDRDNKYIRVG
jgi:hypothetical protein